MAFEPGCVVEVARIDATRQELHGKRTYLNLLLEAKGARGDQGGQGGLVRGCKKIETQRDGGASTIYSIGLARDHHEALSQLGAHHGVDCLENYEIKMILSCIADAYHDDLDPRSIRQISVGTHLGGPDALVLSPAPAKKQQEQPTSQPPVGSGAKKTAAPIPPTPEMASSSYDYLGLNSIGQGLWTVLELPKHLPIACCASGGGGKPRKNRNAIGEDEEEISEPARQPARQTPHTHERDSPPPPPPPTHTVRSPLFYDAASIDWCEMTCPSSAEVKQVSKFEANVIFAFLNLEEKTQSAAVKETNASRHLAVYSSGKIHMIDFSNNMRSGGKELPISLGSLSELICLRLHNESLVGLIPWTSWAPRLSLLEALDLSDNGLVGEIDGPALGLLTQLEVLNLSQNKLSGVIPKQIENLQSLESLILNDNLLSGPTLPHSVKALKNLRYVDLSHNVFAPALSRETILALLPPAVELFM